MLEVIESLMLLAVWFMVLGVTSWLTNDNARLWAFIGSTALCTYIAVEVIGVTI